MIPILIALAEKIAELTVLVGLLAAPATTYAVSQETGLTGAIEGGRDDMTTSTPYQPQSEGGVAILRILGQNESKIETIRSYAEQYGADPDLAVAIVHCESNFEQYAKNKDSSAESYFQFLDGTWRRTLERMGLPTTTSKFAMPYAMTVGAWLLKTDGTRHWEESRKCWEHEIS